MIRSVQALVAIVTLIAIRMLYVWLEANYNVALLDMMTTPLLTGEASSEVQDLGHKLAALGLALLITPLVVTFTLKGARGTLNRLMIGAAAACAGFAAVYSVGFHVQAWAMDTAVETTSAETRYKAYYASLFRQLYVDGSIEDPEFSPARSNASHVMWLPFGVSAATDLPTSLQESASDLVFERAQKQAALERFDDDYDAYKEYQSFTQGFLRRYEGVSEEALAKADPDKMSVADLYGRMVSSIYQLYPAYQKVEATYREHLNFMGENRWLRFDVGNLFELSVNEREWSHRSLLRKVGLDGSEISVGDWCDANSCPGPSSHLEAVIRSGLERKYASSAYGIPMGLTLGEFLTSHQAFNQALVRQGYDPVFEDSPVNFKEFRREIDGALLAPDLAPVLKRWYPQVNGQFIPAGMSNRALLESDQFQEIVAEKVGTRIANMPVNLTRDGFFVEWLSVTEDLMEEKRSILLPESAQQMLDEENTDLGLGAVRLLYIPPIAAAISAVMIVLNLAAIFSSALPATKSAWFFRSVFLAGFVVLGAFIGFTQDVPSSNMEIMWNEYRDESPGTALLWQTFFGFERTVSGVASDAGVTMTPLEMNQMLDSVLGWAH